MKKNVIVVLVFFLSLPVFAGGQKEAVDATDVADVEQVVVSMWIYDEMASSEDKAMVRAARDFEAMNPGITIEFQNVPHRGLMDKFIAASVTGKVPDVVHVALAWSIELGAMGHAEPLDKYIGDKRKEIPKGALESSSYRGQLYGIPWYVDTTALFYNKEMFKAAGLDFPGDEPMNWAQLLDNARKLTRDLDGDGTIDQYGFAMRKGRGASICWFPIFFSNNGQLYSEDGLSPAFNSPEGLEAFRFLTDMYTTEKVMPPGTIAYDRWDDVRNAFISGKMAMYIAGNWEIGPMTDGAMFDWGLAPHPMQKTKSAFLGGSSFIIPSKAKNKEAAWKWLDFLTDSESMKYLAEYGRIPARIDADTAEHILANPLYGVFASGAVYAKSHASIYAGIIRSEVGAAFEEVMVENRDPKEALDAAAVRVQAEIRPDLPGI
ncbi:MAG: ABC transporter substrate-binding protein [Spirochaetales bacterium]|nr:ABC transporter substrate-binding protein [Spirochaetales bacterium]